MTKHILVAGIGNIFMGDDAFGVETVRELMRLPIPAQVQVVDFGIRSYDLAYAMMDGYDFVILVDAISRGNEAGTVYLIEPELEELTRFRREEMDAHSLNPVGVLQMVKALGGKPGRLYLVGCEPAVLEAEDGNMALSEKVRAAVPKAVEMIQSLCNELLQETKNPGLKAGLDTGVQSYA
ncbi:MAG: hydrogenase maturation protease [Pedosphaera sp.]|nr:hydrogenase maturation protease [Pedosphaera sp.]